jgi:hypothetical protein
MGAVANAAKRLWSLVHGYDDIRGSRLDNNIPEGPTEEERAAARAMAVKPPADKDEPRS